jgi:hypothetical protein
MSIFEILLIIYLPLWLLAVIDATIAKFDHWYYQFGWLLSFFLVPGAPVAYLLFGVNQTTSGGFGFLRRRRKERT